MQGLENEVNAAKETALRKLESQKQPISPQSHTDPIQKATGVDQQKNIGQQSEFCDGSIVTITGLVAAKHLNGETGQLISFQEDRGRWGVKVIKSGEMICVMQSNLSLLCTEANTRKNTASEDASESAISPDEIDRFKRMAYAFVVRDYYEQPKSQRSPPTESQLGCMVESRYKRILQEFRQHGSVNCVGYEFFDAPDSPVPLFGSELAEAQECPMSSTEINPQGLLKQTTLATTVRIRFLFSLLVDFVTAISLLAIRSHALQNGWLCIDIT
jgi:hypothetical protein